MLPRVNLVKTDNADYLLFATRDAISANLYYNGSWDASLLTISQMFYANEKAPLVLDIGANLGAYAVPVAKSIAAQGGMVYAFEPQRIVYYQLCGNVFLNRLENVHAFNVAIGNQDGIIPLPAIDYSRSINIGGFSLDEQFNLRRNSVETVASQQPSDVPIARLDTLNFPKSPALIKIDVEGLELDVLKGGTAFLERHGFPPLLLEAWNLEWFSEKRAALLDYLKTLGYTWFAMGDELVAQHPSFARQVSFETGADGVIRMNRTR
ncbi:FkbM family methyltransferase [Burkholderia sp. PR2]|uniref:FkbM family methyltransferase n=1 Tax=Burkholderia sp. PR2 TaxID=3448078 RepID=UPI00402AB350